MMKHIFAVTLMLIMLIGVFPFSVSAKTVSDVVSGVTSEQVIFDDMYQLCAAVDGGDAANIFQTVLIVYPDLVAMIKKNMNDDYIPSVSSAAGMDDARYVYAVTNLMQSHVFLEDLAKLTETVSAGDAGKIYECILEIYPDFVITLKKGLEAYSGDEIVVTLSPDDKTTEKTNEYSALWTVCAGAAGIAVGAVSVYVIMKKKNVADPQE